MEMNVLKKAPTNDRMSRMRPESTQKGCTDALQVTVNGDFAEHGGDFAREWAKQCKSDQYALPTFNEITQGLLKWYISQTEG